MSVSTKKLNNKQVNLNQSLDEESQNKQIQKAFTHQDLLKFDNPSRFNTIGGDGGISTLPKSPHYPFSQADRNQYKKQYVSKNLSIDFKGAYSPGPAYNLRDIDSKYKYKNQNATLFSGAAKQSILVKKPYEYYLREDNDFSPDQALNNLKQNLPKATIGTASRFESELSQKYKSTPGAQYDIKMQSMSPSYSLGQKRNVKGQSALLTLAQTPKAVGPGSYIIGKGKQSRDLLAPSYSLPKQERFRYGQSLIKHETYSNVRSLGKQVDSKFKNSPGFSISKTQKALAFQIIQKNNTNLQNTYGTDLNQKSALQQQNQLPEENQIKYQHIQQQPEKIFINNTDKQQDDYDKQAYIQKQDAENQKHEQNDGESLIIQDVQYEEYKNCMNQQCQKRLHCNQESSKQNKKCQNWLICFSKSKSCLDWSQQIENFDGESDGEVLIPNILLSQCVNECSYDGITEVKSVMDCTLSCAGCELPDYSDFSQIFKFNNWAILFIILIILQDF
ncbi:hypothetical protein PPERSA_04099 [Pseudocohnilembus persalinus]|uniref:Uncharacterized protein n=1 Tax=Pseudocohnilembus persalinus TaxID=266149 RepID=A0A0V0QLN2_PSEPJ|nr:hypothetical protein PPERSA_04099 [Pseudocohnilembus persalinus]|eukprot:KRX02896.1 hypothetical protein PPERSA_04099 [Pseudocohnilembus persalinus]